MSDLDRNRSGSLAQKTWWDERSALEKVGVVALGVAAGTIAAVVVFPHAAAAVGGGALTATGGLLLKKAFGK